MNWYKALKRSTIVLSIFYIGILCAQVTAPECVGAQENVWYKVSTDDLTYGDVIRLDMSKGQAFSKVVYIYLIVQDLDTQEIIYLAFPNGGYWFAFSKEDSLYLEMEKDIDDLQKYLDSKSSKAIKKNY